ncbi:putative sodium-coupled neutral amino acid transporter 11 [Trichonephila clavipes]|nr:putative sodium-coupled neutral amino acid transporter 11 [Trichonephila clavipes]
MARHPGASFQQDNAMPHTAYISLDCLHAVNTLPWPARSPELSLIEHADGPKEVKSNLAETSFNYINSVIGSGIVGIPYALQQAGIGMGIILLLLIAVATDYSLCIMIKAGTAAGVTTYQALIQSQFGKPGYYFLTIAQFIYPLIAMISYNIIIGDTITKVLMRMFDVSRNSLLGNRHFIVFLCTLFVTLPLSLYRTIVRLSLVSFLSLVFAASIVIFVVIRSFTMVGLVVPSSDGMVFANTGFTEAVGVIAFASLSRRDRKNSEGLISGEYRGCSICHFPFFAWKCLVILVVQGRAFCHEQKTMNLILRTGVLPCVDVS